MINYKVLQLLLLVTSMASQALIKGMEPPQKKEIGKGIAQKIEELPKELQYNIFSSALALRESTKYEVYKKFDVGSDLIGIALNADNTRALTGSFDGIARIWDVENGKLLKELKGHTDRISSVALSADGTLALTGSMDGTTRLWNMNTGELLKTLQVGSGVLSVALSADGTLALTGSFDGTADVWTMSTGELIKKLPVGSSVFSVALSADGTLALTGSMDQTARLWNINTGELLKTLQAGSTIGSVGLNADGTIALTVTTGKKVLVWDAKSGILVNTLLPNSPYISSVALSKDGKRALVGAANNKIQVWNTQPLPGQKEISTPLIVLEGHANPVVALAFGGDDFIASGSLDNTVLIWKPFALEPRGPQERQEILRQAYKETFSRPILRSSDGD